MTDQARSVPWYRSLRFKLVATAITVELVMLSALLVNSFYLLDKEVKSQTQTRLEAFTPLLDAALAGRVFQRDHAEVAAILNRLTSTERTDIHYIAILDPAGKIIASSGQLSLETFLKEDHSIAEALTDLTYDVRLPLTIAGNEVGTVRFGLSLAAMVATQHRVVREGGLIAAAEILLSLLLLATGGYLVTRHIRALTEGTRRVAQGNYNDQILISGHDEIALLASDFNSMAAAVATHVNELRASEMRFAAIFNAVGEAIFVYDCETSKIIDVNLRMCEMYGYTREEAIGNYSGTFSSGVHPYTVSEAIAKTRTATAGTPQVFDWHARAKDGRIFWVEISMRLSRIGDNDRLIAVVRDIGERKQMEEARNTAIARFQTLVDNLDALVYVADMVTYELLFINKYGREIWGEITGKLCWQTLQTGQSGPCSFCTNNKLLDANGNPTGTVIWEFQNTVTKEWYECRDQAIQWTDGRLVRMEIAINTTRRKAAEDDLAAEREQLAVTLRSIGDGVITTDTRGRVVLLNTVAETLTGWSQQEAQGRPLTEIFNIIHEQTRKPCDNPAEKVLASGKIIGLANHTTLIAREGKERKIADSAAPIRDRAGWVIGVVLVFRDVTEKQRTEEELVKIKKLESVGVLAGGIAHDFNNILVAILGNINLALLDGNLEEKTRKLLSEAEKASIRAKGLTQQLLTFSKGGEPVKQTTSIAEIIQESADFVLHGSNVACRYSLPEDLWLVDIDKGQMSQVIQNIIINANHAMPDGGNIQVNCENIDSLAIPGVSLPVPNKYIKITISDNGIGIPKSLIDKIFDPYFTTKEEGSGLGLAVTHSIIAKHNGSISVESQPGEGTTFTLYLPASIREQKKDNHKTAIEISANTAKIMVMDDEEMVRDIAKAILLMLGHDVILAANGDEAVELYKKECDSGKPFDIIIMDLTIPGGMGGESAVQEILAINPEAKVIVSSGYSNDPVMAHYQDYGFSAAIVKPFEVQDIMNAINKLLPPNCAVID
ncbi:MAG: PAS domain S-box protein [Desulfocapsaceae bacterium]|nr:PAS domain S-box protein [Desulfocapsaceae bacterium]